MCAVACRNTVSDSLSVFFSFFFSEVDIIDLVETRHVFENISLCANTCLCEMFDRIHRYCCVYPVVSLTTLSTLVCLVMTVIKSCILVGLTFCTVSFYSD